MHGKPFSVWGSHNTSTSLSWPSSVSVATKMSSMKVAVSSWFIRSLNRLFIIAWKVAGEFVNPKYMTMGSYALICVMNATFHLSPSLILTLLYPYLKSNFVNTFLFPTLSNMSVMRGKGYLFFIVYWFMYR